MNDGSLVTGEKLCDVSVVIPVYNEAEVVDECFSEVCRVLNATGLKFEVVFVDDGSTDGSIGKLKDICRGHNNVVVVRLKRNYGQQKALLAGLRRAVGKSVVTYDADLQFPPECIPRLVEKVFEGYDVVGGVRERRKDNFLLNCLPSTVGQYLINRALGVKQKDFGSIKCYSCRLVRDIISSTRPNIIIPAEAYYLSDNFVEIPIQHRHRKHGCSKWSVLRRMESYLDIFTAYAQRPFEWMMIGGSVSILLGLALAVGIVFYKVFVSPEFSGLIIFFDIFLILAGLHFFGLSLIGEFVVRSYRTKASESAELVAEVYGADGE